MHVQSVITLLPFLLGAADAGWVSAAARAGKNAATVARAATMGRFMKDAGKNNSVLSAMYPDLGRGATEAGRRSFITSVLSKIEKLPVEAAIKSGLTSGLTSSTVATGLFVGTTSINVGITVGLIQRNRSNKRHVSPAQERSELLSHDLLARDDPQVIEPPPVLEGVEQEAWETCFYSIMFEHITIEGPIDGNNIQIKGVPQVCMDMNPKMGDLSADSCGDKCIEYKDLTDEMYDEMYDFFSEFKG